MDISTFLPLLGMASGICALFVDPKKNQTLKWLTVAGVVAATAITIGADIYDGQRHDAEHNQEVGRREEQNHVLSDKLDTLTKLLLGQAGVRDVNRVNANRTETAVSIEAVKLKQSLEARLPAEGAKRPQIFYFPHLKEDVNPEVVLAALRQIGASVQEKQISPKSDIAAHPTNCVWAGDKVSTDEARAVALTLAAAGVKVRDIRRLSKSGPAYDRTIEVGFSEKVIGFPVLTPEQLASRAIRERTDPQY